MSLTPEQFNKLTTRKEHLELKQQVDEIDKKLDQKFDQVLTAVDGLAKKFDNFHAEMAANQAAHHPIPHRATGQVALKKPLMT